MPNSFDPDQGLHSVLPDLGPNCLKRYSSDNKRVKFGEETKVSECLGKLFGKNYFLY